MKHSALLLLVVTINVLGQLAIKQAMLTHGEITLEMKMLPAVALRLFTTPMVILGLLLYGAGAFLWMLVLSRTELSLAYPMLSLSYILISFLSWWLFQEPMTAHKLLGTIVICLGVLMITRS